MRHKVRRRYYVVVIMNTTRSYLSSMLVSIVLVLASAQSQALMLTPSDALASTSDNTNLTTLEKINAAFSTSYTDLALLWKGETDSAPAGQDGTLADSYLWLVDSPANSGTIAYVEEAEAASCPTCLLIVKDGRSDDAQYLFDLESWDGTEEIALSDFWMDKEDAISNVAIWGGSADIAEPSALMLMSLGLLGLVFSSKRRHQA